MPEHDIRRELAIAVQHSIEADESALVFRNRIAPLLARIAQLERARRGLTDVERELLEALHDRLALVRDRITFALRENTVDHALPSLQEVRSIYQGAAFLEAMLMEPIGPANA